MQERKKKRYERSTIQAVLSELNDRLKGGASCHPILEEFTEKYGIPSTTIFCWFKKYGTPDRVPDSAHFAASAPETIAASAATKGLLRPSHRTRHVRKAIFPNPEPVPPAPPPVHGPNLLDLKLLIADLVIENARLRALYG